MPALAEALLTDTERRVLDRLVELLTTTEELAVHGVWLYGSSARGTPRHPESDVDLLVITDGGRSRDTERVDELTVEAAAAEGANAFAFSVRVRDPAWVAQRREIDSFFIREVDRDKIVLAGKA